MELSSFSNNNDWPRQTASYISQIKPTGVETGVQSCLHALHREVTQVETVNTALNAGCSLSRKKQHWASVYKIKPHVREDVFTSLGNCLKNK